MKNINRRRFLSLSAGGSATAAMALTGCENQLAKGKNPSKTAEYIIHYG